MTSTNTQPAAHQPGKPRRERPAVITVRLDQQQHELVKQAVRESKMSMNAWCVRELTARALLALVPSVKPAAWLHPETTYKVGNDSNGDEHHDAQDEQRQP